MISWLRRHWKWVTPLVAAIVGVGAWLVFGYFGLHLIFIDDKVDEPPPIFASGAGASGLESDFISEDLAQQMTDAMADEDIPAVVDVTEELPMDLTEQELEDLQSSSGGEEHQRLLMPLLTLLLTPLLTQLAHRGLPRLRPWIW